MGRPCEREGGAGRGSGWGDRALGCGRGGPPVRDREKGGGWETPLLWHAASHPLRTSDASAGLREELMTTTSHAVAGSPPFRALVEGEVVQAEHLTKRFGDLVAVDDLSFALGRGTVTGFLGPNGAGKTTTLRMLLHLLEPTAGSALVVGRHQQAP